VGIVALVSVEAAELSDPNEDTELMVGAFEEKLE